MTGLPMDHIHQYISESWKKFTANATVIVNSLTELQMILPVICYIYRHIDKTPTELHTVFRRLYDKLPEGNTDGMKQVSFFWRALSIFKSISKFIFDGLTDITKITDESFFDGLFLSVSLSVKYLSTDCDCKYRRTAIVSTH